MRLGMRAPKGIPEVNSVILLLVFDQHCSCCVH